MLRRRTVRVSHVNRGGFVQRHRFRGGQILILRPSSSGWQTGSSSHLNDCTGCSYPWNTDETVVVQHIQVVTIDVKVGWREGETVPIGEVDCDDIRFLIEIVGVLLIQTLRHILSKVLVYPVFVLALVDFSRLNRNSRSNGSWQIRENHPFVNVHHCTELGRSPTNLTIVATVACPPTKRPKSNGRAIQQATHNGLRYCVFGASDHVARNDRW